MNKQKVSFGVLIPINLKHEFLENSLNSVFLNTPSETEILLALHKPTLGLSKYIDNLEKQFSFKKIVSNAKTLGGVLNEGIRNMKSDYVFRMDSDDIWLTNRYKAQTKFLDYKPDAVLISGGIYVKNFTNQTEYQNASEKPYKLTVQDLLLQCPIAHPTVLYNRNVILDVGGYNEKLTAAEDYDLWSRLIFDKRKFDMWIIPDIILQYNYHAQSQSVKKQKAQNRESKHIAFSNICRVTRIKPCMENHRLFTSYECFLNLIKVFAKSMLDSKNLRMFFSMYLGRVK